MRWLGWLGWVGWLGLVGLGVSRGSPHFRTKFAPNRCLAAFFLSIRGMAFEVIPSEGGQSRVATRVQQLQIKKNSGKKNMLIGESD